MLTQNALFIAYVISHVDSINIAYISYFRMNKHMKWVG